MALRHVVLFHLAVPKTGTSVGDRKRYVSCSLTFYHVLFPGHSTEKARSLGISQIHWTTVYRGGKVEHPHYMRISRSSKGKGLAPKVS